MILTPILNKMVLNFVLVGVNNNDCYKRAMRTYILGVQHCLRDIMQLHKSSAWWFDLNLCREKCWNWPM